MRFPFLPALKELAGKLLLMELQADAAEALIDSQKRLELKARELEAEGFPQQAEMLRASANIQNGFQLEAPTGAKRGRPAKKEGD